MTFVSILYDYNWQKYVNFKIGHIFWPVDATDAVTHFAQVHLYYVIMGAIASQITSLTIVYSTDYSGAYQSKHQSSASLAFVRGIHRGPVNYPHKWPVTRKMSPSDDVIMYILPKYFLCSTNSSWLIQDKHTLSSRYHGWLSEGCILSMIN